MKLLLILLAVFCAAFAGAQMVVTESIDSIDAQVLRAKTVVVGRIEEVAPVTPTSYRATFAVEETLKGEPRASLEVSLWGAAEAPRAWRAARTRLLLSVSSAATMWPARVVDLDDPKLLVSREDFTLVRDPRRLLEIARRLARRPTEIRAYRRTPPDDDVGWRWRAAFGPHGQGLQVPYDEGLERWARDALRAGEPSRRLQGVYLLQEFRSGANARRVRRLLKDPAYEVIETGTDRAGVETRYYPVRAAANRVLAAWHETPAPEVERAAVDGLPTLEWLRVTTRDDLPLVRRTRRLRNLELYDAGRLTDAQFEAVLSAKGLTSLSLTRAGLDDARMRRLAGLRALRAINLDGNPFTDAGLRALEGLPSLAEASLRGTGVTGAGLDALRRARPGIVIHRD
jgi:hypothetical protein